MQGCEDYSKRKVFKLQRGTKSTNDLFVVLFVPLCGLIRDCCLVALGEFAHGYLTLEDDTEVSYQTSAYYAPEHGRGVRWNDPGFNVSWPTDNPVLIERDRDYPDFSG